jgi:hypothetical protein
VGAAVMVCNQLFWWLAAKMGPEQK